jgi:ATP-dependent Lhr-like helicase
VLERFFDESGGMQLVVHSPFGSRLNRAWGLALRKRFCRQFNFELQAAATEDAIVLSLSTSHSFRSTRWRAICVRPRRWTC